MTMTNALKAVFTAQVARGYFSNQLPDIVVGSTTAQANLMSSIEELHAEGYVYFARSNGVPCKCGFKRKGGCAHLPHISKKGASAEIDILWSEYQSGFTRKYQQAPQGMNKNIFLAKFLAICLA